MLDPDTRARNAILIADAANKTIWPHHPKVTPEQVDGFYLGLYHLPYGTVRVLRWIARDKHIDFIGSRPPFEGLSRVLAIAGAVGIGAGALSFLLPLPAPVTVYEVVVPGIWLFLIAAVLRWYE